MSCPKMSETIAADRIRRMRRFAPIALVVLIACGPFFHQAPPPLAYYPERQATKHWRDLLADAAPLDPARPPDEDLDAICLLLVEILGTKDTPKRLAQIDLLLELNRSGEYSAARANFLHEAREIAADPENFEAAGTYLTERAKELREKPMPRPPTRRWNIPDEEFERQVAEHDHAVAGKLAELDQRLAEAAPAMQPYRGIRRAAFLFQQRRYDDALTAFQAIALDHPDHPRAEVAALMVARCELERSRAARRDAAQNREQRADHLARSEAHLEAAERLLLEFIAAHPDGRFTPDALGWLGAVAHDRHQFGAAVRHQIERVKLQPTREILTTALRECDMIFGKLMAREDGLDWVDTDRHFDAAAVAREPLVARLFIQHCLDPAARVELGGGDNFEADRRAIDFLNRRILKSQPFIRRAMERLGAEISRGGGELDETSLTLLAWVAAEMDEPAQALALLDRIRGESPRDDALHARAIMLQRLGRHEEAVAAFDHLEKAWPGSPLLRDADFRRADSLTKSGRHGAAIARLAPLVPPYRGGDSPSESPLQTWHQLAQSLDTLVQFAPLAELENALDLLPEDDPRRAAFRNTLRCRAIASRDFARARRHWQAGEAGMHGDPRYHLLAALTMDEADWRRRVAPLEKLYRHLEAADGGPDAPALHLAIARHWMDHRGWLTMPALAFGSYANDEEEKQELLRRRNALDLGFEREQVNHELDGRDEATHALEHALAAAAGADPQVAAVAMELASHCLFRRAEFSLYQRARAIETGAPELSRHLHQQLQARFPDSEEARNSAWLTYLPAGERWMPGDYHPWRANGIITGLTLNASDPPWTDRHASADAKARIRESLAAVEFPAPGTAVGALPRMIVAALDEVRNSRIHTGPDDQEQVLATIDRLDDLAAAASLPDVSLDDYLAYADGRHAMLPAYFGPLLQFRSLAIQDDETLAREVRIERWTTYLDQYPDSPKAEAASLRRARLIARGGRGRVSVRAFHFPDAPIPNGYKRIAVERERAANPEAVLASLAKHDRRFADGRYRDDIDLLRAGALIDAGRYTEAIALLERILATPHQRELHPIAALNFADIAQRLIEPKERPAVIAAFRGHPEALPRLERLVSGDTCLSRLEPLMPWFRDALVAAD